MSDHSFLPMLLSAQWYCGAGGTGSGGSLDLRARRGLRGVMINDMIQYIKYRNVFHTEAFRVSPFLTLWRLAAWLAFHVLPRRPAVIKVKLGDTSFRLRLLPILRYHGSSGIYVQRS